MSMADVLPSFVRMLCIMESVLKVIAELDVEHSVKEDIQELRNSCFPEYSFDRSYYKQLPHYRVVEYKDAQLIGYMGLDYRVVSVNGLPFKTLGVIDLCVSSDFRGKGLASEMLASLSSYAECRDVDFLMSIADDAKIYASNGFSPVNSYNSWLRIDEHKNYGVAVECIDDLYIKQVGQLKWPVGHVDWLGYMF